MSVSVRPAVFDDLPSMLEIYGEAVMNTTATYDYEPRTLEYRVAWFEEAKRRQLPIFVATDQEQKVLGWSGLKQYSDRVGYRFTAENSIYVASDQRGRGLGRLLLPPILDAGKARGLHTILAAIDAENEASIQLHASFGFQRVGLFKQVGFKFGRWLDVLFMERLL